MEICELMLDQRRNAKKKTEEKKYVYKISVLKSNQRLAQRSKKKSDENFRTSAVPLCTLIPKGIRWIFDILWELIQRSKFF